MWILSPSPRLSEWGAGNPNVTPAQLIARRARTHRRLRDGFGYESVLCLCQFRPATKSALQDCADADLHDARGGEMPR